MYSVKTRVHTGNVINSSCCWRLSQPQQACPAWTGDPLCSPNSVYLGDFLMLCCHVTFSQFLFTRLLEWEMRADTDLNLLCFYAVHAYFHVCHRLPWPWIQCMVFHLLTMFFIRNSSKVAYEGEERAGGLCRALLRARPGNSLHHLCPPPIGQSSVIRPPTEHGAWGHVVLLCARKKKWCEEHLASCLPRLPI